MSQQQFKPIDFHYRKHGFLPAEDPLIHFPADSPLTELDNLGRDLPS
jgi:hypothetical protein